MSVVDEKLKSYPVTFTIDPPGKQSRFKALFRLVLVVPIYLWMLILTYHLSLTRLIEYYQVKYNLVSPKVMATASMQAIKVQVVADSASHVSFFHPFFHSVDSSSAFIVFSVFIMIVFRKKYPRWLFAFNLGLLSFGQRVTAYVYCLTAKYPSADEEQGVHLNVVYPEIGTLNRGLPFIKWLLLAPHYVCLAVLWVLLVVAMFLGWIVVVITGQYPAVFFDYIVGVMRWTLRVLCYGFLLMTDEYPPFSLK